MIYEYTLSGKWLELLKELAPNVTRVAIIRNPDNPVGVALFGAIQAEARLLSVEVSPIYLISHAGILRRNATARQFAIKDFVVRRSRRNHHVPKRLSVTEQIVRIKCLKGLPEFRVNCLAIRWNY